MAFAKSLFNNKDPSTLTYNENEMSEHLVKSLQNGKMTEFPATLINLNYFLKILMQSRNVKILLFTFPVQGQ